MERTTVRLPSELLARARKKAAAEGRTLTSLIEEGLREALSAPRGQKQERRVLLPVSSVSGGLGVDDVNLAKQAQELDDIEYVKRMKTFK